MRTKLLLLTLTAVLIFGAFANVSAQAPTTFLYQGRLTDTNDQPIAAATSVTFKVVSTESGSYATLYSTVATVTPNDNGVFTIELGPLPESAFTGGKRWLSVTVGGSELLPRQLITSVPYAMNVGDAPGVAFKTRGEFLFMSTTGTNYVVDSLDITAPSGGYVEVTSGGYLNMWHANGTKTEVWVVISDVSSDADFDNDAVAIASVPSTATGMFQVPFHLSGMYPVTAGSHRFYINARYVSGGSATDVSVAKAYLRMVFYPTAYGSVASKMPHNTVTSQQLNLGPDGLPLDDTRPGR